MLCKLQDVISHYANPPLELPADVRAVKDAIGRALRERSAEG